MIENAIHQGWTEESLTRSTPGGFGGSSVLRKCSFCFTGFTNNFIIGLRSYGLGSEFTKKMFFELLLQTSW